jgi:hypothetical protein
MIKANRLSVGDPVVDRPIFRVRLTLLLGLMATYSLWRSRRQEDITERDAFIGRFIRERTKSTMLWGEAAVPQICATYFYLRSKDATLQPEMFLAMLVRSLCRANAPDSKKTIPSPYFEAEEVLLHEMKVEGKVIKDAFGGTSHTLEGLVHLLARTNLKQLMKQLWPDITKIDTMVFVPQKRWQYYQWRSLTGQELRVQREWTQSWRQLRTMAAESDGRSLPRLIKRYPAEFLAFLLVFPHRFTSDAVRWLDRQLVISDP